MATQVLFRAIENPDMGTRDGEEGWEVFLNGRKVTQIRNDQDCIADGALDPLWKELDLELTWDEE